MFKRRSWTFWPTYIDNNTLITSTPKRSPLIFICLLFFAAVVNLAFLKNQLWQDELYSLDHFILVPVTRTLTDYHDNNNHIVFSLLSNVYLQVIGIRDPSEILDNPWIIRILPYAFTLMGIACFYLLSGRVFGDLPARISSILLVTSLQTYSFGTQVRGYSLGTFLFALHFLLLLRYRQVQNKRLLLPLTLLGALALINLPSALYTYAAIGSILLISASASPDARRRLVTIRSVEAQLLLTLAGSIALASLYFLTLRQQIAQNTVILPVHNSFLVLLKQPFAVFYHFIDLRYFILIPAVLSFLILSKKESQYHFSIFLAGSFFLPFLFFALHDPMIIPRTWIVLLPVFCLFMGQIITPFFMAFRKWLLPFEALCILALAFSFFFLRQSILHSNGEDKIALDLKYQYHLFGFNPNDILDTAVKIAGQEQTKIRIDENFQAGIRYYARYRPLDSINRANKNSDKVILLTDKPLTADDVNKMNKTIVDYGKNNDRNFYKWYLLRPEMLPVTPGNK